MSEIKNLKRAARRIKKAVSDNERIILFGDSDLDGTTSVLLLEETLMNLGAQKLSVYFPEWESEDYGLNRAALQFLKPSAPALLVVLDCGIGNFEEVKAARAMGFSIIVIDHHEILGTIPDADIVVDPKQKGDRYSFKKLTTVCLVYRLSEIMLGTRMSLILKQGFGELAAIGAVADMMPEEDLNAKLIGAGSQTIKDTLRPGIIAMLKAANLADSTPREIFKKLTAILNITAVKDHLTESYILLKGLSSEPLLDLAKDLIRKAEARNQEIFQIVEEISQKVADSSSPIIFEGRTHWSRVLSGAVASRLCNKYKKPTFIFRKDVQKSRGSVRTAHGLDAVAALKSCSPFLLMYGGHPPAAGFTVSNEKIDALKECLEEYFKQFQNI
ncbi:MAG: DHH family phosphoesterase [Candidatus Pacebacteria bacterium]|nr:DHH family phosphoesterase [Candidatus Paceibacterota bacterium]